MKCVALHGFGGSPNDWDKLRLNMDPSLEWFFLTLPGHAKELPCDWLGIEDMSSALQFLRAKIQKIVGDAPFLFLGYSLGARLVLQLAANFPQAKIILLSAGLGYQKSDEREGRKKRDDDWAKQFTQKGYDAWGQWYEQSLFTASRTFLVSSAGKEWLATKTHDYAALARALVLFSPANHDYLGPCLAAIDKPLYLVGERDEAYSLAADAVRQLNPGAVVEKIPAVGHILHQEAPQAVAALIALWRNKHGI